MALYIYGCNANTKRHFDLFPASARGLIFVSISSSVTGTTVTLISSSSLFLILFLP